MAMKITIDLDLNMFGVVNPHFYAHEKELLVNDIINYTPDRIIYVADLETKDLPIEMSALVTKKEKILSDYNLEFFEILSVRKNAGTYSVLISQKFPPVLKRLIKRYYESIFLIPPIRISVESMKFNFLMISSKSEVFLNLLKELGVPYTVTKTSGMLRELVPRDQGFKPRDSLTPKQKSVLRKAYDMGLYDMPRKISMKQFSQILGISPASTHRILKRIERKAIAKLLESV